MGMSDVTWSCLQRSTHHDGMTCTFIADRAYSNLDVALSVPPCGVGSLWKMCSNILWTFSYMSDEHISRSPKTAPSQLLKHPRAWALRVFRWRCSQMFFSASVCEHFVLSIGATQKVRCAIWDQANSALMTVTRLRSSWNTPERGHFVSSAGGAVKCFFLHQYVSTLCFPLVPLRKCGVPSETKQKARSWQ